MSVIPFRFRRPCVVLSSPGWLLTGEVVYVIEFMPSEADGGGCVNVWDGSDYEEAILATHDWERDGVPCHNLTGKMRP